MRYHRAFAIGACNGNDRTLRLVDIQCAPHGGHTRELQVDSASVYGLLAFEPAGERLRPILQTQVDGTDSVVTVPVVAGVGGGGMRLRSRNKAEMRSRMSRRSTIMSSAPCSRRNSLR